MHFPPFFGKSSISLFSKHLLHFFILYIEILSKILTRIYKILGSKILENDINNHINFGYQGTANGEDYLIITTNNKQNLGCGDIIQHLILKMNVGKVRSFHATIKKARVEEITENPDGFKYKFSGKVLPRSEYEYKFEKRDILKNLILDGRS